MPLPVFFSTELFFQKLQGYIQLLDQPEQVLLHLFQPVIYRAFPDMGGTQRGHGSSLPFSKVLVRRHRVIGPWPDSRSCK